MSRALNFSAGPAALPLAALERAREELLDFAGSGMSVMEQSHRGKVYEAVHFEAMALLRKHLEVPEDREILFLQGGATQAFATLPMNLLEKGRVADYVVNGAWGEKAVSEARAAAGLGVGEVHVAATTEANGSYARVPKASELRLTKGAAYVHVTSNETIHGVQYALAGGEPFPEVEAPLVCDMSSDILGRRVDMKRFGLVYAGAQKNIGPSGVTIVIVTKELLDRGRKDLPTIFQLRAHAEAKSLLNTPPTFGIYLVRNVMAWMEAEGGLAAIEARNRAKARVIYDAIAASGGFYTCPVEPSARSIMNVVWRLPTPELEAAFVKAAEAERMVGLKGHRVLGGIRASLYNAVEPAWCEELARFMKDFAKGKG